MRFLFLSLLLVNVNLAIAEEVTPQFSNDLKRLSNDLKDLQRYVYAGNEENKVLSSKKVLPTSDKISDIEQSLKNLNLRLESLEIKIDDLYSLYINSNEVTLSNVNSLDDIKVEVETSNIVTETNTNILGEISINNLELKEENSLIPDESIKIRTLELEGTIEQPEIVLEELNIINELKLAKNYMTSLDNNSAIISLMKIIESSSDDVATIAEAYYLIGRTHFIKKEYIEAVKYFGVRHRDFQSITQFKVENYYWLAKSLIQIGDKENACLVMEDIIFSSDYGNNLGLVEDSKSLQEEQGCGLIVD